MLIYYINYFLYIITYIYIYVILIYIYICDTHIYIYIYPYVYIYVRDTYIYIYISYPLAVTMITASSHKDYQTSRVAGGDGYVIPPATSRQS